MPGDIYLFRSSQYALQSILFYVVFAGLGGNMILLGGAMNAIDTSVIEAGKIDGAGLMKEMTHIIIPSIWPTFGTLLLLQSISILSASGPLLLFTNGEYNTMTLSYWIYSLSGIAGSTPDFEYAAAIGLVMTLITLPISLGLKKLLRFTEY